MNAQDTHEDLLLAYAVAFDAGNLEAMTYVLRVAGIDSGLEEAIRGLHTRFQPEQSFTKQLLAVRASLVKSEVKG